MDEKLYVITIAVKLNRSKIIQRTNPVGDKIIKKKKYFGGVAQLGEHLPCTQGVRSSTLLISTKRILFKIDKSYRAGKPEH
jgi:hypothetical protein